MTRGKGFAIFCIFIFGGLSIVGFGLLYPTYQFGHPADTRSWGPYSINDESGNPTGNLWLKFSTADPVFAVGSYVGVEAQFRPWAPAGYPYSYVVFFPNSTSPSAPPFAFNATLPPPQFGEVLLHYDSHLDMYVGNGTTIWLTPGLQGVEVRLLDIPTNSTGRTVASADNVMVVASEEALQSAKTNNLIVGLTFVVIGIAVIQLSSVYSDFRKSTV